MAEEQYNQANQEPYAARPEKKPCIYCLQGKCAERKAAGLCGCKSIDDKFFPKSGEQKE